ncbi:dynactin subunit 2 [Thrips palmi]|uniref:Dynactin subunit 2 n=1 Tax=Thrips palmi TaxID=161013 RepID=A0A6P8YTN9_THRPL|nr:dynactin subunit 2 [Thrips palmi]
MELLVRLNLTNQTNCSKKLNYENKKQFLGVPPACLLAVFTLTGVTFALDLSFSKTFTFNSLQMADPKYANLPGIAYDQPDVYETGDLPEADQNEDTFEEENECIERLHLSASESFLKFKDKQLSGSGVDFSDRLKKVPNRGYDARSGIWELVAEGEKETLLQKYQRLQCEMKEFVEEVAALKDVAKGEDKGDAAGYKALASNIERAQKQLSEFRLEETLGPELLSSLKDPETAQIKKLFAHFETYKQKSVKPSDTATKQKATAQPSTGEDGLLYQLRYRPEQSQLQQASRVAELEQRLNKLESILGTSNENMARLGSTLQNQSISSFVQNLESRISLLDQAQIDSVDARLSGLVTKMDSIAEKVNGQSDPEKDAKVTELYELVKKTEAVSSVLPQTVKRLTALESLHREASNFSSSLSKLEAFQLKLAASLQGNEKLLQSVEKGFAENVETIKKNMSGLDQRLAVLSKK